MKRTLHLPLFIISILFILASCRKPGHDTQYVTLSETIVSGATYTLDLSAYGDADDQPSITQQATAFTVSRISTDASTGRYTYSFSSDQKNGSKETVVVTLKETGHRHNCNRDEAVITINFTIN